MTVQLLRSVPQPNGTFQVTLFDENTRLTAVVDKSTLDSPRRDHVFQVMVDHERERLAKAAAILRPEVTP